MSVTQRTNMFDCERSHPKTRPLWPLALFFFFAVFIEYEKITQRYDGPIMSFTKTHLSKQQLSNDDGLNVFSPMELFQPPWQSHTNMLRRYGQTHACTAADADGVKLNPCVKRIEHPSTPQRDVCFCVCVCACVYAVPMGNLLQSSQGLLGTRAGVEKKK